MKTDEVCDRPRLVSAEAKSLRERRLPANSPNQRFGDKGHVLRSANRDAQIGTKKRGGEVADENAVFAKTLLYRRGIRFRRFHKEEIRVARQHRNPCG